MWFYMVICNKGYTSKYVALGLLAEVGVILTGFSYHGTKSDGTIDWSGGGNIDIKLFESCTNFRQRVRSWNTGTNSWVKAYVFKRCKFLKNKMISQVVAFLFVSVWHGFHSGYYLMNFHLLLILNFEDEFFSMINNSSVWKRISKLAIVQIGSKVLGKCYVLFFYPHASLPFVFLDYDVYFPILWNTGGLVFIFFGTWPVWKIPLSMLLKPISGENESIASENQAQTKKKT